MRSSIKPRPTPRQKSRYRGAARRAALSRYVQPHPAGAARNRLRQSSAYSAGRYRGSELPDTEATLPELKARIAKVQALLATYKPEQLDGSDSRQLTLKLAGADVTLSGREYLLHVALPNFYFHCTTAYNILRHNGLEVGKRDFLGRT